MIHFRTKPTAGCPYHKLTTTLYLIKIDQIYLWRIVLHCFFFFYAQLRKHHKIYPNDLEILSLQALTLKEKERRKEIFPSLEHIRAATGWLLKWNALLLRRRREGSRLYIRISLNISAWAHTGNKMFHCWLYMQWSLPHCLQQTSSLETCRSQASRSAARAASPGIDSWCLKEGRPSARSVLSPFSSKTSSWQINASEHAVTCSALMYGQHDGSCQCRSPLQQGENECKLYIHRGQPHQSVNKTNECNLGV